MFALRLLSIVQRMRGMRFELGYARQRLIEAGKPDNPKMVEMQELCGLIERRLHNAYRIASELDRRLSL